MCQQVIRQSLYFSYRSTVEFGFRVDDIYVLYELSQFLHKLVTLWKLAYEMKLVAPVVESQLLPYVQYEVNGIRSEVCVKAVGELEAVLLKTEHVDSLVVEIGVQLHSHAREAAPVQMIPHRSADMCEADVGEMVVNDQFQVFVY